MSTQLCAAYASRRKQLRASGIATPVGHLSDKVSTRLQALQDASGLTCLPDDVVVISHAVDSAHTSWRTSYLDVAFPSNWDPASKLGLDFAAIHAPVADNELVMKAAQGLTKLAFAQQVMKRHVWLLSPEAQLDLHPNTRRTAWSEVLEQTSSDEDLLASIVFRVERQLTWPMPDMSCGVFLIRVLICPLLAVLEQQEGRAKTLYQALASMSDAVLAYRGMTALQPRLLGALERRVRL